MSTSPLGLHEEVLLLALHDHEGTITAGSLYPFAVGGAVLAELLMRARIVIAESGESRYPQVINPRPVGDVFLDECLARISRAKRRRLRSWVAEFAHVGDLKHRVARQLCDRGILREDEGRFLLLFSRRVYPESDPSPEREIVERLRLAIFTEVDELTPRTVALVSLAHHGSLLEVVFDRKALVDRTDRLTRIVAGEMTTRATRDALQAMHTAVTIAVLVPTVTAAAIGS